MKEYKILRDTDSEITKKLNNWRHNFHIDKIAVLMDNRVRWDEEHKQYVPWGNLVVMITRERKENNENKLNLTKMAMDAAQKVNLINKDANFWDDLVPILICIFGKNFYDGISADKLPQQARNRGYQVGDSDLIKESFEDLFKQYKEKHNGC